MRSGRGIGILPDDDTGGEAVPSGAADPVVLFICEHGSAKSVVAAAHFTRLAAQRRLNVRAVSRGTSPDAGIAPQAAAGLRSDGLAPLEEKPRKLSTIDLEGAARVVAFCELPKEYENAAPVERWTDVPPISENYQRSREAILQRIIALVEDLKAFQSRASELR